MEYNNDVTLILNSLNKDKKELMDKVNEIDKLIKRIKYGNMNFGGTKGAKPEKDNDNIALSESPAAFPLKAELKVQVIKVMDILGVASKLNEVAAKYHEITGFHVNLRETMRNLNKHEILKLLQPKNSIRGLYWVKAEWLDEDNHLKPQHKFEGFDLLFTDEQIEFK